MKPLTAHSLLSRIFAAAAACAVFASLFTVAAVPEDDIPEFSVSQEDTESSEDPSYWLPEWWPDSSKTEESTITVYASIYETIHNAYLVTEHAVTLPEHSTVLSLLDVFMENRLITSYTYTDEQLNSIHFGDVIFQEHDYGNLSGWIYTLNGDPPPFPAGVQQLSDGDRVEFRYMTEHALQTGGSGESSTEDSSLPESSLSPESSQESSSTSEISSPEVSSPESSAVSSVPEPVSSAEPESSLQESEPVIVVPDDSHRLFTWTTALSEVYNTTCDWLRRNPPGSFYLISLGISGKGVEVQNVEKLLLTIEMQNGEYTDPLELAQDILSVTFCGLDPQSFRGINLVQLLGDFPGLLQADLEKLTYALIALDSNNYPLPAGALNTREQLVQKIIASQNPDGGFSLEPGDDSDPTMTATVITALSSYITAQEDCPVQEAINQALSFMREAQQPDGLFISADGQKDSLSLSALLTALSALKTDYLAADYAQGGKTLVDLLLDFQNTDGGFALTMGGDSSVRATEQVIIALTAIKNAANPLRLKDTIFSEASDESSGNAPQESGHFSSPLIGLCVIVVLACCVACFFAVRQISKKTPEEQELEKTINSLTEGEKSADDAANTTQSSSDSPQE
ncbi:MAG TPA: DUF4430 domain-containing protein [Firmicutes bacterium]|nr:DUF4430 domain-containing protein [Bacillota bacterium]